jgi:hypothetical protein
LKSLLASQANTWTSEASNQCIPPARQCSMPVCTQVTSLHLNCCFATCLYAHAHTYMHDLASASHMTTHAIRIKSQTHTPAVHVATHATAAIVLSLAHAGSCPYQQHCSLAALPPLLTGVCGSEAVCPEAAPQSMLGNMPDSCTAHSVCTLETPICIKRPRTANGRKQKHNL